MPHLHPSVKMLSMKRCCFIKSSHPTTIRYEGYSTSTSFASVVIIMRQPFHRNKNGLFHRRDLTRGYHGPVMSRTSTSSRIYADPPPLFTLRSIQRSWSGQAQTDHQSNFYHQNKYNESTDKNDQNSHWHENTKRSSSSSSSSILSHSYTSNLQMDFFGEPVSFLTPITLSAEANKNESSTRQQRDRISDAMAALDSLVLAIVSRGQTCHGGGSEDGLEAQSAHSMALTWAEGIRHAAQWNQTILLDQTSSLHHKNNNHHVHSEHRHGNTEHKLSSSSAPMLAVAAVAPLLAQTGLGYTMYVDHLLKHVRHNNPNSGAVSHEPSNSSSSSSSTSSVTISLLEMARSAVQLKTCRQLYPRERWHLQALDCMLQQEHRKALVILNKLLQSCPGDGLAVALAMDLAHKLGDRDAALSVAGAVAGYWNDRRATGLRPAMPGHYVVSAWVALGFAAGGRFERAELLADRALQSDRKMSSGVATWALAHVYDAEGRTAEGISWLANTEGRQNYEKCGLLFFSCLLGGYGAHFSIDREGWGRLRSAALRLYVSEFQRVLEYSGFAHGKPWQEPQLKAPWGFREVITDATKQAMGSFWSSLFNRQQQETKEEKISKEFLPAPDEKWYGTALKAYKMEPTVEDVLCWLPPTPQMLTQATLLLFRLTINGTISPQNPEWDKLRNAWSCMHQIQTMAAGCPDDTYPLATLAANLLSVGSLHVARTTEDEDDKTLLSSSRGHVAKGLRLMGEILDLGNITDVTTTSRTRETALKTIVTHERVPALWSPEDDASRARWKQIVNHLYAGVGGTYWSGLLDDDNSMEKPDVNMLQKVEGWEMDIRPILEHAICYAACKSGDMDALFLARGVCSKSVSLRPNSPEEWWRYSMILSLLGDEVAADDAFEASIEFGSGQGQG